MNLDELKEEISIEFEYLQIVIDELLKLRNELTNHEPTTREKTAAGAFLAQFYNGIENILKRFYKYFSKSIQSSVDWHIVLFKAFCDPPDENFPLLFSKELELKLIPFRKFRHVFHHGYGFQVDWDRIKPGVDEIESIFFQFKNTIEKQLSELSSDDSQI